LNRQTRQVTRLPLDCKITQYSATEYEAPMAQPRPIKFGFPVVATQKRSVMYSDLDENMHMNNTRYAEWICDLLGYERLHDVQISELQINFLHESDCTRTMELELSEQGRSFCVCGYDEQDRTRLFEAEGVLK
jgi:acyl-ACP thioesterase